MSDCSDNGPDMSRDWSKGANPGAGPNPKTVPSRLELPGAPFGEETESVLFFPDEATADTFRGLLPDAQSNIAITFRPKDRGWRLQYRHFRAVPSVFFLVPYGDSDFLTFAKDTATVLPGSYENSNGARFYRTVKVVECPEGFDLADSEVAAIGDLIRNTPKYSPPEEADNDQDQCDDGDQDDQGPESKQDTPAPTFPDRSKKIEVIRKWRDSQTAKGKTPPTFTGRTFDGKAIKRTFVDHWWYGAIICDRPKDDRLPAAELAAAAIIKSTLLGPWTFECWPGPGRAAKCSTVSRMTWRRNRDSLEKKGVIELEYFGNGVAPIIYPIVPGLAYRSVFAPSNRAARKKKKDDDK